MQQSVEEGNTASEASSHAYVGGADEENLEALTLRVLEDMEDSSDFFASQKATSLPFFSPQELETGQILGRGEFGTVREVVRISDKLNRRGSRLKELKHESFSFWSDGTYSNDSFFIEEITEKRESMRERAWRQGKARYAVKCAREDLGGSDWQDAVIDLAAEAKFLASISHPSIVKLRAIVGKPGRKYFMMIMDRLHLTFPEQVQIWKKADKRRFMGICRNEIISRELMVERMKAAFDVARALRYLHKNKIVFRDLKPENAGFDVRGDVRLFDFGLAKELKPKDLIAGPDEYNCTGYTGTLRWMSPEVCLAKPYGLSSDVYSFGLLLWHLVTLKLPYGQKTTRSQFVKEVVQQGKRPSIPKSLPRDLRELISGCWKTDPKRRMEMAEICDIFTLVLGSMRGEPTRRESMVNRTRHLIDMSTMSLLDKSPERD